MYSKLALFLATGFYSGYAPKAPGTAGTVVFWLLWYLAFCWLGPFSMLISLIILFTTVLLGLIVTSEAIRITAQKDPQCVVIDEWAGLAVTLCFVSAGNNSFLAILLALVGFRFFDICKCWPISTLEKLPGTWGVMFDDLAAGILAGLCILAIFQL